VCATIIQAMFVYDDWLEGGKEGDPKASVTLLEASSAEARAQRKTVGWKHRRAASCFLADPAIPMYCDVVLCMSAMCQPGVQGMDGYFICACVCV